jgi:hypothetical protein
MVPRKWLTARRWWPLWQLGALVLPVLAGAVLVGSGWIWAATYLPQLHQIEATARAPRDPPPATVLHDVPAKLRALQGELQRLQQRLPPSLSTLQIANVVDQAAQQAGVTVQGLSVGAPTAVNGVQGTAVSISIRVAAPLDVVRFLQALEGGTLTVSVQITAVSLTPGAATVSIPAIFYSTGGSDG